MQGYFESVREQVWLRMRQLFDRYTGGSASISPAQIEQVLRKELGRDERSEIDYVLKNLFRLDTDGSGDVDFTEFATYMLKRHCGEVSLQDMHRDGLIARGSERLINVDEFLKLLNRAYKFLGVSVDSATATAIFREADTDHDGHITYTEYFNFIDVYLVRATPKEETKKVAVVRPTRRYRSRLRQFLWAQLKLLFEKYDENRDGLLTAKDLEAIARDFFGSKKKGEFEYVVYTVFQMRSDPGAVLAFEEFAHRFLKYIVELSLSRLGNSSQRLSQAEFLTLVRTALVMLRVESISEALLIRFFLLMDRARSGLIGFEQLLHWVNDFLAVVRYEADEYYIEEDDVDNPASRGSIAENPSIVSTSSLSSSTNIKGLQFSSSPARSRDNSRNTSPHVVTQPRIEPATTTTERNAKRFEIQETSKEVKTRRDEPSNVRISVRCPFTFSSLSLANRVRKQILTLLARFDANNNKEFEQSEIIEILQALMKEDRNEVKYVIANVFRYDKNNDKIVTYDELSNFFLEIHCGEIAIQRLHRKSSYKRGAERVMDLQEFIVTMNYALSFISITPTEGELTSVFNDIDRNHDGLISYQEYFEFLRYYFGSESWAAQTGGEEVAPPPSVMAPVVPSVLPPVAAPPPPSKIKNRQPSDQPRAEQRFSKLVRTQTRVLLMDYDVNRNVLYERQEVEQALSNLFKHSYSESSQILEQLFRGRTNNTISYDQLNGNLLSIHFGEVWLKRQQSRHSRSGFLSLSEFQEVVQQASHYLPVKLLPIQLEYIFNDLDTNNDDFISHSEYSEFIRRALGSTAVVHPPIANFQPFWASGLPF